MNTSLFRNALEPWGLWIPMLLLPLLVLALYFLKLRRQPIEVPSTYLWQQAIEDLHVNSLWQRLRQSLLLFLQLLLLALAVLALLQPGWAGSELEGQRFIFLIDNSASMGALDSGDDETRLAAAKRHVEGLIDQMTSGMSATLIAFNDEARVVQEFTSNKGMLKEALAKIELSTRTSDLLDALQIAHALASPPEEDDQQPSGDDEASSREIESERTALFIFSDGRFAEIEDFDLGNLKPTYVPLGTPDASNLAVTAFSTRRGETRPEERQAFVQVTNFSAQQQQAVVELSIDDRFLDAQELDIPANSSSGVTFALTGATSGKLTAMIADESLQAVDDALAIDNTAYAALNDSTSGRTLIVTPGNQVLAVAMATERVKRLGLVEMAEPSILATKEYQQLADSGAYDLIVYDQCVPESVDGVPARMPRANTLFIGRIPPMPSWRGQEAGDSPPDGSSDTTSDQAPPAVPTATVPQVIDWAREHPLLAYVEMGNIHIQSSKIVEPPRGGRVLIDSTDGPIFSIAPREGFEDAVLGFEILVTTQGRQEINTNWYNRSFPTFVLNLLDYFVAQEQEGIARTHLPGRPIEIRTRSLAKELKVLGPTGESTRVPRNDRGSYMFYGGDTPGTYEVVDASDVVTRFAVNLFDGQESDIRVQMHPDEDLDDNIESAATLQIGHVEVEAQSMAPARQNYWRPVLLAAFGLLLFEWYIYNRRVYL